MYTHPLLIHVTDRNCTDPDCEVHCAWVGLQEETVGELEAAFFLAGAQALMKLMADDPDDFDSEKAYEALCDKLFPHP